MNGVLAALCVFAVFLACVGLLLVATSAAATVMAGVADRRRLLVGAEYELRAAAAIRTGRLRAEGSPEPYTTARVAATELHRRIVAAAVPHRGDGWWAEMVVDALGGASVLARPEPPGGLLENLADAATVARTLELLREHQPEHHWGEVLAILTGQVLPRMSYGDRLAAQIRA